jgi:hypothetical protein
MLAGWFQVQAYYSMMSSENWLGVGDFVSLIGPADSCYTGQWPEFLIFVSPSKRKKFYRF